MDERYDCVRTVRNQRYVYVRNYMPHKIYGQHLNYMWETPTTQVWERLYKEGKLNDAQKKFWEPKPAEELYDLETDRDEVSSLAGAPAHQGVLEELRKAHREHELKIRDIGLLPEGEIHARAGKGAPYDAGHNPKTYPFERILAAAEAAASLKASDEPKLAAGLQDSDSGVRYWSVMGLLMRKRAAPLKALQDPSPSVCIAAAESLGHYGKPEDLKPAMDKLVALADPGKNGPYVSLQALAAIDSLGVKAKPWKDALAAQPIEAPGADARVRGQYIKILRDQIAATLG
jgi:uncharacterized sulfatase